eukprot:CAMPEP_0119068356 /NCGR_PEP_ID=MMETSP1178-20130426/10782_1 /TAXON_ID=33656 /ORGANISM="unid sp, Strain CCMP2000" /LENGTH=34 /DNA_ID= /DNA_START= /DNA_END= /DNA_ORIENTATION=
MGTRRGAEHAERSRDRHHHGQASRGHQRAPLGVA